MKKEHFPHMKELVIGFAVIGFVMGGLNGFNVKESWMTLVSALLWMVSGVMLIQIIYLPTPKLIKYGCIWLVLLGLGIYYFQLWGAVIADLLVLVFLGKYFLKFTNIWLQTLKENNAG